MAPNFVRPPIRAMHGYTPGEQPAAGQPVIKLNTNENPYPPTPRISQVLTHIDLEILRRYPSPTADAFRAAVARLHGLSIDHILAGNGSDDSLSIAARTFVGPNDILACPDPTYSLYPVLAEIGEARYIRVPWAENYTLPTDGLLAAKPRAIFFANPNAPTGTLVPPDTVRNLARRFDGLVLVDEAYADFANENCIPLVREFENVIICRTLSKAYSLAGLRFGYIIAQPSVCREMMKVKDSYNCDALSILVATTAIEDQAYARQTWQKVRAERERLTKELKSLGWPALPSHTNFLLATAPNGDGRGAYLALKQQGILVRYFDMPGLRDKLRITVGTPEQDSALLAALKKLTKV